MPKKKTATKKAAKKPEVKRKAGKPLKVASDVKLGPIAKFVNKKMHEANLNAKELAEKAGVPVPAVYRFVHHGKNLHVKYVTELLAYFGVKF
jgi:predicted transcriptional regulator